MDIVIQTPTSNEVLIPALIATDFDHPKNDLRGCVRGRIGVVLLPWLTAKA